MFLLGKISKSRGNKGEVICQISPGMELSHINFSGKFELRSEKHNKTVKIDSYLERGSSLVIKFDISNSISDSFGLVGYEIFCDKSETDEDRSGLKGFLVIDINGLKWGTVCRTDLHALNKTIEVFDGEDTIMIPFDDSILVKIDKPAGEIVIDPPAGLKDLNKK